MLKCLYCGYPEIFCICDVEEEAEDADSSD